MVMMTVYNSRDESDKSGFHSDRFMSNLSFIYTFFADHMIKTFKTQDHLVHSH